MWHPAEVNSSSSTGSVSFLFQFKDEPFFGFIHFQATMSSVEYLKGFVNERLTAAAAEIFRVFEKTIVQYEEELDRQRRLLDIFWKPEIKLQKIELPQQHVCQQEEDLNDHQLCIQERSSSLDQEDPEPAQIKEEQEQLCTSQEREQRELKQETETLMLTATHEESVHSEDHTPHFSINETQSVVEEKLLNYILAKRRVVSIPESALRVAESQDQKGDKHWDSESTTKTEPKPKKGHLKNNRTHKGDKPYSCNTCGKRCCRATDLKTHMRTHTGEKPYLCKTCGKFFRSTSNLVGHMKVHTGEKPYSCKTCGNLFSRKHSLLVHIRRAHTGEKPYICKICGTRCFDSSHLAKHMRSHTDK